MRRQQILRFILRQSVALRAVVILVALGLATPAPALAHEKWFTDARPYPVRLDLLGSLPVGLGLLASVLAVGGLVGLRRLAGGDNSFPRVGFLRRFDPEARVVLGIQTAIALIYMGVNLHVLAPNLDAPRGGAGLLLAALEVAIAFSFISGVLVRAGAVLLAGLVLLSGPLYGAGALLEQVISLGIALYMFLAGRTLVDPARPAAPPRPWDRYQGLAPIALRVCAGFTIAVLAFTEKLLNPALGMAFLRHYPSFNAAHRVGLSWFTDERFIYAAGIVELIIGVALISGVLPRLVIIGMLVPFNLPVPFLPPTEMIGHLPIFGLMYVLLFSLPAAQGQAPAVRTWRWSRAAPWRIPARHGAGPA